MEKARAVPKANASVVQMEMRQAAVGRKTLAMFENVSNAANGVDERREAAMVHFVP